MPVEVVGRDVEAGRRQRPRDECDQCSWKLDSSTARTSCGSGCSTASSSGVADVAGLDGPQAGGPQHRGQHPHRRGLAVRAGDGEPGRGPLRAAHPPGELDLAPDRHPAAAAATQQRAVGPPARRGDDEVGARRRSSPVCSWAEPHVDAEDVEHAGALVLGVAVAFVDDHDAGPAVEQRVGGGEAGDADAGDDDAQPRPRRLVRTAPTSHGGTAHAPTTHSA